MREAVDDLLDVSEEVALWELLEDTPTGVELAKLVASVDRDALGADEVLRLAVARQRLIAHLEAQTLADLHRVARTVPTGVPLPRSVTRQAQKYPWAEVDCAFALRWTHGWAAAQLLLADEVINRFLVGYEALEPGVDLPAMEREVLAWWREWDVFRRSLAQTAQGATPPCPATS